LKTNKNVELCFHSKEAGIQIRISGKAVEVYNYNLVEDILSNHPDLQNQIAKHGKDVIALFSVKNWQATLWNNKNKEQTLEIK